MKKLFAFLATAMLALMLVGCGGEKKEAPKADEKAEETTKSDENTEANE